jgi:hypothetical protein
MENRIIITNSKVIVRIRGGLGNQLFCYAAGRRLALVNNAELVIDNISGFEHDNYQRRYGLNSFNISGRLPTPEELMLPLGRFRRKFARLINKRIEFDKRWYLEQEGFNFDSRIINFRVNKPIILDGYWQSEGYFKDISLAIRKDLTFRESFDSAKNLDLQLAEYDDSVAIHFRWFDMPGLESGMNLSIQYYINAITYFDSILDKPRYYLFSDNVEAARNIFQFLSERIQFISDQNSSVHSDLFFMSRFKYFILSNSTLNWWGAWLATNLRCVTIPSSKTFPILAEQHKCLFDAFVGKGVVLDSK